MKLKHNSLFFWGGGRKTLKHLVLQQLSAKAKGTNKHAKWTGRKQLRKIAKLQKIVKNCGAQPPHPRPRPKFLHLLAPASMPGIFNL